MTQSIRYNTFETNSSSVHSLVLLKNEPKYDWELLNPEWHIEIVESSQYLPKYSKDPEFLLSYIYTIALIKHKWKLIDTINQEFPNCIFQRPQWQLPYDSITGYCDDRRVISFCDLMSSDLSCYYSDEDFDRITNNLRAFIFKGELYNEWDSGYKECVKTQHKIENEDDIKAWIADNVICLIGEE